jgi:hypothetical protein
MWLIVSSEGALIGMRFDFLETKHKYYADHKPHRCTKQVLSKGTIDTIAIDQPQSHDHCEKNPSSSTCAHRV